MSGGRILRPGGGPHILGGGVDATVKTTTTEGAFTATFEMVVPPGYDVGAHVHREGQEMFYVLSGALDVLAFEPVDRSVTDWHQWKSAAGETYLRGEQGAFMWVPPDTPHAFANTTDEPVRMLFQSSMAGGHEKYFEELAAYLREHDGAPDQAFIVDLRDRYGIEQLTGLTAAESEPDHPTTAGRES